MSATITCGERLVDMLAAYGVDTVFGIPGNHTVPLYRGLSDGPIRHVSPRHEQGAGFMADGYARATGKPGVCFLISGPGLTNALTPMMQALADSVPMLVVTAVAARDQLGMGEGHLHELPDQRALASQCARFSHTLMRPDELPRVLARAFAVFSAERPGPVHIELPLDVITADASHVDPTPWPMPAAPGAHPDAVAEAARMLASAQRPCLIVGGGAVASALEVQELAERFAAPVVNTVNAKGVMPETHPLAVGSSPSLGAVREVIYGADLVLAVGTEFGETDYDMLFIGDLALQAPLIRIDIDARQLSRNQRPTLAICADARAALSQLLAATEGAGRDTDPQWGQVRVAAAQQAISQEEHTHPEFQALFAAVKSALPGVRLVGDSTLPTYYAVWQYEASAPRHYFHSATGGGTLGYAIPAALGAKLADTDTPVVALIGDGSAQFTLTELAAGVESSLSVVVIVWNNNGYSEIEQGMHAHGFKPVGVDIPAPDFCAIAAGMGCKTAKPENLGALAEALETAQSAAVPTVIELRQEHFVRQPAGQWYGQGA